MSFEELTNNKFTNNILENALSGCDDGELYLEDTINESFLFDDNVLKSSSFNKVKGFGLRAINDELVGYSHSNNINITSLKNAAEIVSAVKKGYSGTLAPEPKRTNNKLYTDQNPIDLIDYKKKIKLLKDINEYARKIDARTIQVSISLSGIYQKINILRPTGDILEDIRPLVRLNISVTLEQNGKKETGSVGLGGRTLYGELFAENKWKNEVRKALRQAEVMLEAIEAPAGEQIVVLGPGWPGILLHEAIGHGLEGDFNRKKISVFTELMGTKVADNEVTVYDDGTLENRRGSFTIDDEGTPSSKTILIEKGKLVGLMQDRQNARLMNVKPTGNGRRQSYAHQPMPRMSNTMMENGKAGKVKTQI